MGLSNYTPSSRISQSGVCTSSTRPATPYEGQVIYETDTDKVMVWNGSAWTQVGGPATGSMFNYTTATNLDTGGNDLYYGPLLMGRITITPTSTSDKVILFINYSYQWTGKNDSSLFFSNTVFLSGSGTPFFTSNSYGDIYDGSFMETITNSSQFTHSTQVIHSPNSTSTQVYDIKCNAPYANQRFGYYAYTASTQLPRIWAFLIKG